MTTSGYPFLEDLFEEEPRLGYYSKIASFNPYGQTKSLRQYYENAFQNVFNQYLGALGGQVRAGVDPTLRFGDYLEQFPFQQQFEGLDPGERGAYTARYAPRTSFLYS